MKSFWRMLVITCGLLFIIGSATVLADEVKYGEADIDRLYVVCDTNLEQLTKDTYQTASITVVKADGSIDVSDDAASVKLRGNSTSKAEKKPFNMKFSSKVSVLGMDKGKKWCVLANAFDKTLMRNALCFDLSTKMGLDYISGCKFVDVYFNNVYKGNYLITEPVDPGTGRVEIDETANDFMIEVERERWESDVTYIETKNGVRFAINAPEVPTQDQIKNIEDYLKNTETALKTYKMSQYSKYIDVDSFVNFYIVCEIFKAVDFNYSSTRFYLKNNKLYAGPVWDVDLSSGNAQSTFYTSYYDKEGNSYKDLFCTEFKWYSYLIKSDEFVSLVKARLKEMKPTIENMYKTNAKGTNIIDTLLNQYEPSFNRNYASQAEGGAGWNLTKRYSTCDNWKGLEYGNPLPTLRGNVEMLITWLSNRVNYLEKEWGSIVNNYIEDLQLLKGSKFSANIDWVSWGVADGFEIYTKVGNGKYKLYKDIKDGDAYEAKVLNLSPGLQYTIMVKGYTLAGKNKVYTNQLTKKVRFAFKSPNCKVKALGKKRVITWKKVNGAKGYVVYSAKKQNGKYKAIATIKNVNKVKYIKKNVSGKRYFKVKAYVLNNGKKVFSK